MKILHATGNTSFHIPPPRLDPQQIICGPLYPEERDGAQVLSLTTPRGEYDAAEVVARLPPDQRPELFVARADCNRLNLPRNVAALGCRTALVIGDTHHSAQPIAHLLDYALSEPYDAVILDWTRQHAHFFVAAGLARVYWLPGWNVRRLPLPRGIRPDIAMSFVGTFDKRHPRRAALIEALGKAGLPLVVGSGPLAETYRTYARSRVNFNCSLNADLNLRVFEVLACGGCLLTDRLSRQTGLDLLFEDGRHLVTYDSVEDCIAKGRRLLADPATAARIARAGAAAYEARLAPERIITDFFALLAEDRVRPEFDVRRDRRAVLARPDRQKLMRRIALYEVMQSVHLARELTPVLTSPAVDPHFLSDAADLPRLQLWVDGRPPELAEFLRQAGTSDQVRFVRQAEDRERGRWDMVVATTEEWRAGRFDPVLARQPHALLLLTDLAESAAAEGALAAAGMSRVAPQAPLFARAGLKV